jgi:hypothetical protein
MSPLLRTAVCLVLALLSWAAVGAVVYVLIATARAVR